MSGKSWVSRYIVPCPGNSSCKHCKPGEPHPQQHVFSKLVHEINAPQVPSSLISQIPPPDTDHQRYLRKQKLMGTTFGNLDPVPFDPKVDPEPFACNICWSSLHMTRHCQEPVTHSYCWNCGRKDVEVEKCKRCSRAYLEYLEKKKFIEEEKRKFCRALRKVVRKEEDLPDGDAELKGKVSGDCQQVFDFVAEDKQISRLKIEDEYVEDVWNEAERKKSIHLYEKCKMKEKVKCKDEVWTEISENSHQAFSLTYFTSSKEQNLNPSSTPFVSQVSDDYSDSYNDYHNAESSDLFTYMRNQKIQEQIELDCMKSEVASNYFNKSEYYFFDDKEEEEEEYEDYIVDEDEKSELLCSEDYTIRFFVDLLDALKHLSIDLQSTAVLNFVTSRKKHMRKKKMKKECN